MVLLRLLLVCLALTALAGCAGAPRTASSGGAPAPTATVEGVPVPPGWLDFSRDSAGVLWLVRRDFQASLSVEELHLSGPADPAVAARMLLALERSRGALRVVAPPVREAGEDGGPERAHFQIVRENGEEVRVAVARRGERMLAVTAVQTARAATAFAELARLQEAVLRGLLR